MGGGASKILAFKLGYNSQEPLDCSGYEDFPKMLYQQDRCSEEGLRNLCILHRHHPQSTEVSGFMMIGYRTGSDSYH